MCVTVLCQEMQELSHQLFPAFFALAPAGQDVQG